MSLTEWRHLSTCVRQTLFEIHFNSILAITAHALYKYGHTRLRYLFSVYPAVHWQGTWRWEPLWSGQWKRFPTIARSMVVFSSIWMNFQGRKVFLCDPFCGVLCSLHIKEAKRRFLSSSRSVYGPYMNWRIDLFMAFEFLFSCSWSMLQWMKNDEAMCSINYNVRAGSYYAVYSI
jgi:hypothetical protein